MDLKVLENKILSLANDSHVTEPISCMSMPARPGYEGEYVIIWIYTSLNNAQHTELQKLICACISGAIESGVEDHYLAIQIHFVKRDKDGASVRYGQAWIVTEVLAEALGEFSSKLLVDRPNEMFCELFAHPMRPY